MPVIAEEVGLALLALGRGGVPGTPDILSDRDRAWRLLMVGDEPWARLGRRLTDGDLIALIRGLILFSIDSGWSAGSVSPVIPLYREFLRRDPSNEPDVTAWIANHRRNDYEPFGTVLHGGARSLAEFYNHQAERGARATAGERRDAERQAVDAKSKAARATERVPPAVRRGDVLAVRALLLAGADLGEAARDAGTSLHALARDHGRVSMVAFLESIGVGE